MGNSVSSETGNRLTDAPRCEGSAAIQHQRDPGMSRQITVCLDGSAAVSGLHPGLQSKVPNLTSADGQHHATTSGTADPDFMLRAGQQKVLLWNCNPSDSRQKDQAYATAADGNHKAAHGAVPAANNFTHSRGRKVAAGDNSDMHPAVSSDGAGSLPPSSSSSSDSSFRGRTSSIDETMPHGPDQSSDEEQDACPQLTRHKVPQLQSRAQETGREPAQAGRLITHSRNSTTPEQVVWVLEKQHFLQSPSSSASSIASSSSSCVMSPSFILPCAAGAAHQSVTTEWCFGITKLSSSTTAGCSFQLGLALRSAAAAVCASSGNPDRQAPGSPMQVTAAGVGSVLEVYCRGSVSVRYSSGAQGSQAVKFESILQCGGRSLDLPVALRVLNSSLDISAEGSQHQQRQQHQQFGNPAALQVSSEEVHVVVEFSATELVQPNISAAAASGLQPATQQQQQQLRQQQDIACSDQNKHHIGTVHQGVSSSATIAAAPVRQLEAVLLSTSPRMLVVDGFFDAQMCEDLMYLTEGKLVRSRVASGSETPSRTSWSHFFVKDAAKHALIVSAEAQIEALFKSEAVRGPFPPLTKVEALQVVKYHKGEFYHEHYDNRADSPLTRAATIIIYLCDTEEGGGTSFPRAVTGWSDKSDWQLPPQVTFGPGGQGIKVLPVQGRALVFWSKRADGTEDPSSIHAADTVIKGHKWIATRWMKDD